MATREMIQVRKRIREIAKSVGFQSPRIDPQCDFRRNGNEMGVYFKPFDDDRESCYNISRGKVHTAFVKQMKKEFGKQYRMTQHNDYYTTIWLRGLIINR